jgi:hypothetical protein
MLTSFCCILSFGLNQSFEHGDGLIVGVCLSGLGYRYRDFNEVVSPFVLACPRTGYQGGVHYGLYLPDVRLNVPLIVCRSAVRSVVGVAQVAFEGPPWGVCQGYVDR